jgi:hypothetical protein
MVGGVSHRHSHCRLSKFRDLTHSQCETLYVAVIGWKSPITWQLRLRSCRNASFAANHSAATYITLYIKSRTFARRQCERQWSAPPNSTPRCPRRLGRRAPPVPGRCVVSILVNRLEFTKCSLYLCSFTRLNPRLPRMPRNPSAEPRDVSRV